MALDRALEAALQQAVLESGQPKSVAQRLQAWLTAMSDGDDAQDSMGRRFQELIDALETSDAN